MGGPWAGQSFDSQGNIERIQDNCHRWSWTCSISRVPYQNDTSQLYNMLEIYRSGPEPSIFSLLLCACILYTGWFLSLCLCLACLLIAVLNNMLLVWVGVLSVWPYRGFPTRTVYLYYMSCLRYTILVGNPRYVHGLLLGLFVGLWVA